MIQVLCGDAISVLDGLKENSIDMVYTCPSPFGYYEDQMNKIGGEAILEDYIDSLLMLCEHLARVIKPTGSLFIQLGDTYNKFGNLIGIPTFFEYMMKQNGWMLGDRLFWHRTETLAKNKLKKKFEEPGFLKNYEFIFHYVFRDSYFNTKSRYNKTCIFSYPLEESYYTNEFDSGLPTELFKMVIDTTTKEGDTVLDPLCGSAKLGYVAKQMNRSFIGIDIDPHIVELCKIRLGIS